MNAPSVPRRVDAVLVTAVVAVLTAGASVGMGRGVGVVGGGIMHFSPDVTNWAGVQSCCELSFKSEKFAVVTGCTLVIT